MLQCYNFKMINNINSFRAILCNIGNVTRMLQCYNFPTRACISIFSWYTCQNNPTMEGII